MSISLHNQEKPICPYCGCNNKHVFNFNEFGYTKIECYACHKLIRIDQTVSYNIYGIEHLRDKNYSDDEPTTNET